MGMRVWHVARAEHNREVAQHLHQDTSYGDWAVTALYYSALHWVDSVLADEPGLPKEERNPRRHSGVEPGSRGRNQLVNAYCRAVRREYRSLEEFSRRTRYDIDELDKTMPVYDDCVAKIDYIEQWARMMHKTRPVLPSDAP